MYILKTSKYCSNYNLKYSHVFINYSKMYVSYSINVIRNLYFISIQPTAWDFSIQIGIKQGCPLKAPFFVCYWKLLSYDTKTNMKDAITRLGKGEYYFHNTAGKVKVLPPNHRWGAMWCLSAHHTVICSFTINIQYMLH